MSLSDDWKFPAEIRGWLTEREGRTLAELAAGKRVLEIGCYAGRSTVCMAQTAAAVDVIDPLDGRATPGPGDLGAELVANMHRYGLGARIYAGTTEEIAPTLPDGGYDLVFIDGDHSEAALRVDVREALRLLAPGGLLAFHDYESLQDPAVTVAVNRLLADGAQKIDQADLLAVIRPGAGRKAGKPVVALAMPRRGQKCSFGASEGFHLAPSFGGCTVLRIWTDSSILDHSFNRLWATALNLRAKGATHFAMIHDDICPQHGWLDMLLTELFRQQADVVSAVVPIKGPCGTTSTAIETDDVWFPRRLTMAEVHDLPITFGDEEAGGELLLNSGLWVCDLRRPWVDQPRPLHFQTLNRLVRNAKGEWEAQVRSEDWEFSRAARARGARLYATRAVKLVHDGEQGYPNDTVWGDWKTDLFHEQRMKALAETEAAAAGADDASDLHACHAACG